MTYLNKYRLLTIVNFDGFLETITHEDEHYALFHVVQEVFVARYSASLSLNQITSMVSVLSSVEWAGEERIRPLLSRLVREKVLRSRKCPQHHVTLWEVNY